MIWSLVNPTISPQRTRELRQSSMVLFKKKQQQQQQKKYNKSNNNTFFPLAPRLKDTRKHPSAEPTSPAQHRRFSLFLSSDSSSVPGNWFDGRTLHPSFISVYQLMIHTLKMAWRTLVEETIIWNPRGGGGGRFHLDVDNRPSQRGRFEAGSVFELLLSTGRAFSYPAVFMRLRAISFDWCQRRVIHSAKIELKDNL